MKTSLRGLVASLFICATAYAAASLPIDSTKSTVTASFKQMGVTVDANFGEFSGEVAFDPSDVAQSSAKIEVKTASLDLGDDEYNAEVRKSEWFDSKAHPRAAFVSDGVEALGDSRFRAKGVLMLKGKTKNISVDFTSKTQNGSTIYSGSFPISRAEFGIGDASWNDVLEDGVSVKFSFVVPNSR